MRLPPSLVIGAGSAQAGTGLDHASSARDSPTSAVVRYDASSGDDPSAEPLSGAVPLEPLRVLIATDHDGGAARLHDTFARHGHLVHVAGMGGEQPPAPRHVGQIAIVSAPRRDASVDRLINDLKQHVALQVILVITSDRNARTAVEILRKDPHGYVRTSSITLELYAADDALWECIAGVAETLCLHVEG